MQYLIFKYLVTAGIVVLVSEIARRNDRIGAMIAALPLVTVLTLMWLYIEDQPTQRLSNHAYYTFWYVLPTLPMFLLFPWLIQRMSFWLALTLSLIFTIVLFAGYVAVLKRAGIDLIYG